MMALFRARAAAFVGCGVVVLAALWGFSEMFYWCRIIFNDPTEDISYGWIVPFFSLYVLWTSRAALKRDIIAGKPSWAGLLVSLPFIMISILGARGVQIRMEQIGFIGLVITIPWTFFGRKVARHFIFPALYLLFTIPLATFLDFVTIHLRLLASSIALIFLRGVGVEAIRQGTSIVSEGAHPFAIDVAAPCSGLRSLFALMALTAAYAWFNQSNWFRRGILFACSIPLAVFGNVMRILTICLVAAFATPDFALGFYHDYSGYVVFLVAISLMVMVGECINRIWPRMDIKKKDEIESVSCVASGSVLIWVATFSFVSLFIFQHMIPTFTLAEPASERLPVALNGYKVENVHYCQNEQCGGFFTDTLLEKAGAPVVYSPNLKRPPCIHCGSALEGASYGELHILPADTQIFKKVYTDLVSGDVYQLSMIIGGVSKSSIHRPELCLPGQGFIMMAPHDDEVNGWPFHFLTLMNGNAPVVSFAYTFFNQEGIRTANHIHRIFTDIWDRSIHNRIDRWTMITVNAPADESALKRFLAIFTKTLEEGAHHE